MGVVLYTLVLILVLFFVETKCNGSDATKNIKLMIAEMDRNGELDGGARDVLLARLAELDKAAEINAREKASAAPLRTKPLTKDDLVKDGVQLVLNYTLADVRLLGFKTRSSSGSKLGSAPKLNFIGAIDTEQNLHVYAEDGTKLGMVALELPGDAAITAFDHDGQETRSPTVVVAADDGSVVTVNLDIYKDKKLVAGRSKVRTTTKVQGKQRLALTMTVHGQINLRDKIMVCSRAAGECRDLRLPVPKVSTDKPVKVSTGRNSDKEMTVSPNGVEVELSTFTANEPGRKNRYATAIHIYQKAEEHRNIIVVGDNYGTITSFYDTLEPMGGQRNYLDLLEPRTSVKSGQQALMGMDLNKRTPVLDLVRMGQILVGAVDTGLRLTHIGRFRPYGYNCASPVQGGLVTRLVIDPQSQMTVYGMTTSGSITVFNLKFDTGEFEPQTATSVALAEIKKEKPKYACKVLASIAPDATSCKDKSPEKCARRQLARAQAGHPSHDFAHVKGMIVTGSECGVSLYASSGVSEDGRQSVGFSWLPITPLHPEPHGCGKLSISETIIRAANGVAAGVSNALGVPLKPNKWLRGTTVNSIRLGKKLGKPLPESPFVLLGYNTPSKALNVVTASGIDESTTWSLPALLGVVVLYKAVGDRKSLLARKDDNIDILPSLANSINWIRPLLVLLVVFFVTSKVSRDRARARKKKGGLMDDDEDEEPQGIITSCVTFLMRMFGFDSSAKKKKKRWTMLEERIRQTAGMVEGHRNSTTATKGSKGSSAATAGPSAAIKLGKEGGASSNEQLKFMENMLADQQAKYKVLQDQLNAATSILVREEEKKKSAATPSPTASSAVTTVGIDTPLVTEDVPENVSAKASDEECVPEVLAALRDADPLSSVANSAAVEILEDDMLAHMRAARPVGRSSVDWDRSEFADMLEEERSKRISSDMPPSMPEFEDLLKSHMSK